MAFPFLDLNITFDVLSGLVALLVSYYAFRYDKLLESKLLKFISLGFMLLGIGLLAEAAVFSLVIFGIGDIYSDRVLALSATSVYHVLQVAAYFVLAFGYVREAYSSSVSKIGIDAATGATAALAIFPLNPTGVDRLRQLIEQANKVFMISELLSVIFLSMVVFQGFLAYAENRSRSALLVILSFILILSAQGFGVWAAIFQSVVWYLLSSGIQFVGFVSLLFFLLWRSKIGSARKVPQ